MMIAESPIDLTTAWQQLAARDPNAAFFYGVSTTGVFCRPDCKSRLPLRENTRFFSTPADARKAGFRACLRCKPEMQPRPSPVAQMCSRLERQLDRPVRLAELGKLIGASPFTAQRMFKRAMGVTPAQYHRAMRASAFRLRLKDAGGSVTDAIYEAGYGSSSRAYEAAPLGMTPGRFLAGGRGETLRFALAPTGRDAALGWVMVAASERGICWLALGDTRKALEAELRTEFSAATLVEESTLAATLEAVLERLAGKSSDTALPLDLRGTAFQLRVWRALQQIPKGETRSYSQLAAEIRAPSASRAVARACATNRVAVLVPCHRVVGASGALTGYRWGVERKQRLLRSERAERP